MYKQNKLNLLKELYEEMEILKNECKHIFRRKEEIIDMLEEIDYRLESINNEEIKSYELIKNECEQIFNRKVEIAETLEEIDYRLENIDYEVENTIITISELEELEGENE